MKQYTYPAVFYYDEEYNQYAVEFSDICIYAEGDTIEDAYQNAQEYLKKYLDCCDELGVEPNKPGTYNFVEQNHPNGKTMLVTVEHESKNDEQEKKQETFTNLNEDIVEDISEDIVENITENLNQDDVVFEEFLKDKSKNNTDGSDDGDDDFSLPEIE